MTVFPYSYQFTLLLFLDTSWIVHAKRIQLDILWFWMANCHKVWNWIILSLFLRRKKKECLFFLSTRYSQMVSHASTNQTWPCLASQMRRDQVRSGKRMFLSAYNMLGNSYFYIYDLHNNSLRTNPFHF